MTPEELEHIATTEREAQAAISQTVNVCVAAGCLSCQSQAVKDTLDREVDRRGMKTQCRIKGVGCMGLCSEGPLVSTNDGTLYKHVGATDAPALLDGLNNGPVERLRCTTKVPFFERQKKIVLENSGVIDPERIEEYIAASGYR